MRLKAGLAGVVITLMAILAALGAGTALADGTPEPANDVQVEQIQDEATPETDDRRDCPEKDRDGTDATPEASDEGA